MKIINIISNKYFMLNKNTCILKGDYENGYTDRTYNIMSFIHNFSDDDLLELELHYKKFQE